MIEITLKLDEPNVLYMLDIMLPILKETSLECRVFAEEFERAYKAATKFSSDYPPLIDRLKE